MFLFCKKKHISSLVPSLVEIGPVVLEKKIFKFCQCIFAISLFSPLQKGHGPSFEQTWITFIQGCFDVKNIHSNFNCFITFLGFCLFQIFDTSTSLYRVVVRSSHTGTPLRGVMIKIFWLILKCYHSTKFWLQIISIYNEYLFPSKENIMQPTVKG